MIFVLEYLDESDNMVVIHLLSDGSTKSSPIITSSSDRPWTYDNTIGQFSLLESSDDDVSWCTAIGEFKHHSGAPIYENIDDIISDGKLLYGTLKENYDNIMASRSKVSCQKP